MREVYGQGNVTKGGIKLYFSPIPVLNMSSKTWVPKELDTGLAMLTQLRDLVAKLLFSFSQAMPESTIISTT